MLGGTDDRDVCNKKLAEKVLRHSSRGSVSFQWASEAGMVIDSATQSRQVIPAIFKNSNQFMYTEMPDAAVEEVTGLTSQSAPVTLPLPY